MLKDVIVRKTLITAILITIGIGLILAIVAFINWYWVVGWLSGCLVTIAGFAISVLLLEIAMQKIKTKSLGFWIGWGRTLIHLIWHAAFFIIVILINTTVNQSPFKMGSFFDFIDPINLFTYLAGLSIIAISIIVMHLFIKRR